MKVPVTNKDNLSLSFVIVFSEFNEMYPSFFCPVKERKLTGYSDSLSYACVTLATTYLNLMVETFEHTIDVYLKRNFKNIFSFRLSEIAKPEELKIKYIYDKLSEKLEHSPTTFNISKNLENFIPVLAFICRETEEEAEVTVEQKEKPELFSFTPNPSLKWRNISINNKSLAVVRWL
ncbi:hypothetical protein BDF21DRAFT_404655 [Thamnidium elegans]|nr:hypothetical protein BDF21DRAFT_404655 [Thamnidium elegans]